MSNPFGLPTDEPTRPGAAIALRFLAALLATAACASVAATEPVGLREIASGLTLPVAVVAAPGGAGGFIVVEQDGRLREVDGDGAVSPTPWLDISQTTGTGLTCRRGERGLLGLAFHPDFASNGYLYLNFTTGDAACMADDDGVPDFDTVIARMTVVEGVPDQGTLVEILRIGQPFANHNGGELRFGPDGLLYVGTGDGGSAGDPLSTAQDPGRLLGKILRIDVDSPGANAGAACGGAVNYGIPADNPDLGPGSCAEIFALGLRNPYRFSFDRTSGDLWIGDVGQGRQEEIDRLPAGATGANFGWDCREGNGLYDAPGNGDPGSPSAACATIDEADLVSPVITWPHGDGSGRCSVTGGFVYRGPEARLQGLYIGADFCSGDLVLGEGAGNEWQASFQRVAGPFSLVGFGEGMDGSLYVLDWLEGTLSELLADRIFSGGFEGS